MEKDPQEDLRNLVRLVRSVLYYPRVSRSMRYEVLRKERSRVY